MLPVTDAILALHGTPTTPSDVFTSTTTDYTDNELDFGSGFPSYTEKGYTNPAEVVGPGGVEMGVHLVITTKVVGTVGGMTAGTVNVLSNSTTNATTIIASRTLTVAQLGIAGAHYFIPVSQAAILEFLRCNLVATTAAADSGKGVMWFGPRTGGEQ